MVYSCEDQHQTLI